MSRLSNYITTFRLAGLAALGLGLGIVLQPGQPVFRMILAQQGNAQAAILLGWLLIGGVLLVYKKPATLTEYMAAMGGTLFYALYLSRLGLSQAHGDLNPSIILIAILTLPLAEILNKTPHATVAGGVLKRFGIARLAASFLIISGIMGIIRPVGAYPLLGELFAINPRYLPFLQIGIPMFIFIRREVGLVEIVLASSPLLFITVFALLHAVTSPIDTLSDVWVFLVFMILMWLIGYELERELDYGLDSRANRPAADD